MKLDPLTKRVDLLASLFQFLLTSAKVVSGLYNTHGSHDKSNVIINQHLSSRNISGESFNFIVWNSRGREGGGRVEVYLGILKIQQLSKTYAILKLAKKVKGTLMQI